MENAPQIFDRMPEFSRIGSFSFLMWAIMIGLFLSVVVNMGLYHSGTNQFTSRLQISGLVCHWRHSQRCNGHLALYLDIGSSGDAIFFRSGIGKHWSGDYSVTIWHIHLSTKGQNRRGKLS